MDQEVLVDGYDNSLIEIILGKIDKTTSVAVAEYGRGSDALYRYFENKSRSVTVIEDFNQTIFQADRNKYQDVENLIEYNVLGTKELDRSFDIIYTSLPNYVPQFDPSVFQLRLDSGFKNLYNALNDQGCLITIDYNVESIKQAIKNLDCPIAKFIVTNDDDVNPEYYICVAYK